jgi:hypothetical protein
MPLTPGCDLDTPRSARFEKQLTPSCARHDRDGDRCHAGFSSLWLDRGVDSNRHGRHPSHTELEMPDGHLLANGFRAGRTWLFDLTQPTRSEVITSFGDLAIYTRRASTRTRNS